MDERGLEVNHAAPWLLDTAEKVRIANRLWVTHLGRDRYSGLWRLGDHCWYAPAGGYPAKPGIPATQDK